MATYSDPTETLRALRERLAQVEGERDKLQAQVAHLGGACDYSAKVKATWELYERADNERMYLRGERDALRAQLAEAQKPADRTNFVYRDWPAEQQVTHLEARVSYWADMVVELESQLAAMGRVVEAAKPYRERGCIHVSPWIRECSLCALVLRDALSALRETERKAQP